MTYVVAILVTGLILQSSLYLLDWLLSIVLGILLLIEKGVQALLEDRATVFKEMEERHPLLYAAKDTTHTFVRWPVVLGKWIRGLRK